MTKITTALQLHNVEPPRPRGVSRQRAVAHRGRERVDAGQRRERAVRADLEGVPAYGEGNVDASDAKTGRRLWQFQTGAGVNAPPITYEVGGEQFVAVASGGNYQLDYPRGDTLWVFSLKGTMGPASAPPAPSNIGPSYPSGQGKTARVALTSDGFVPMRLPIAPGTTVTWTNDTSTVNTVTSETGAWDSGALQPGQSFSYTFRKTGPYDYASTTHPGLGGVVVVWPTRRRQP